MDYKNPIKISSVRGLPENVPCAVKLFSDFGEYWENEVFIREGRQTWVYYDWSREKWTDVRRSLVNDQGGGTLRPCAYVQHDFDPRKQQAAYDYTMNSFLVAFVKSIICALRHAGYEGDDALAGVRHALGEIALEIDLPE